MGLDCRGEVDLTSVCTGPAGRFKAEIPATGQWIDAESYFKGRDATLSGPVVSRHLHRPYGCTPVV